MAQEKFTQDELMQLFGASLGGPAPAPAAPPPPAPAPVAPAPPAPPVAPVAPPPAPLPVPPVVAAAPPLAQAPVAVPPPPPLPVAPVAPMAPPPVVPVMAPPAPPMAGTPFAPPPPPMSPPTAPPAAAPTAPNAPVAGAPPMPPAPEVVAAVDDLGHQFEIGRVRMEQVLTPFIGDKVTKKMLAWSLERAQKTHPILKNVHWSQTNDLLDNGEVEVSRLVKNIELFPAQPILQMVKAALADLIQMRLAAVEQGLGPSMKQAVEKEVARLAEILR